MEVLPDTSVPLNTPQAPEDNTVSLPVDGDSSQPVPVDVARSRARKATLGLGDVLQQKEQEMVQAFITGNENQIRKQAATSIDFRNQMKRYDAVQALAKNGPLEKSQVDAVMNDPFLNTPTDPDTVIENAYATKAMGSLSTAQSYLTTGSLIQDAQQEIPKQVQDTLDQGSDLLTKNQYLLKKQQDAEAKVSQQGWGGYLVDTALNFSQVYQEILQRGLIGSPTAGLGIGSNLDQAHYTLYQMPLPQFKAAVDSAMANLESHNPQLAAQYAQSLRSQTTFDTVLGNTFSALAVPDVVGGAKVIGSIGGKVDKLNRVRKAAHDIVDAAAKDVEGKPQTLPEGAGDVKEAAAQKINQAITDAANGSGNPLEMAETALLSTWYSDAKKFMSNPGTYLSRELITRTADDIAASGKDLYNRLATSSAVERTPAVISDPDSVKALMDAERTKYKGPANTLLDISEPIREPLSGTYWWKSTIGNYDATLFPDAETAAGFARQIGLSNPIIKGVDTDIVYLPEAAAKRFGESRQTAGGSRFFDQDGVEILSSPEPKAGMIPFDKKTGQFGKALTDEQAKVAQQGLGFYIEKWTPLKEDDNLVRDLLIKDTKGNFIPDAVSKSSDVGNIAKALMGWARTSDETMSVNESAQRKAVTYAQNNIHKWAEGLAKDLEDIANGRVREDQVTGVKLNRAMVYPKSWLNRIKDREVAKQFERTLDYSRRALDENGEPGAFFKTPGDLRDFYMANFKRDPSYLETKAYFNFVKLIEGDRMMREVSEFRYRARLGAEQHSIGYVDKKTGETVKSPFFDGITQNVFPGGDEQILVISGSKPPIVHQLGNNSIPGKTMDAYKEAVKEGRAKIIQIYDRNQMPLSAWTDVAKDKLIRYVMVDRSETKPIEFNHVKRRGGGHFEWDYDYYLKQADVRKQDIGKGLEYAYVGDTTVMPIKTRKLGDDIVKLWNEAHEYIKRNEWDKVKPIAQKLGIKYDEFTSWYHPGRDAAGNPTRPMLNAHEPIVVVDRNKKISEMDSNLQNRYRLPRKDGNGYTELFRDATKSGPENNFKVQYNQERNSSINTRTINDIGSQGNPIYAHQPAEMIDPLTTMNRALNRVINSTFMDDYKIYTVEHWLREAAPYLNASEAELRSAPFAWFQKPEWRSAVKDSAAVVNLMNNRMKAQQFIGQPSKFDTWIHSLTTDLVDNLYENKGPNALGKVTGVEALKHPLTIAPIWMLQHVKDPVQFIRSVTFNFKLGLFAIPQFLVQAQTHSLIWALEPRHGTAGTYAMLLHAWGSFTTDENILRSLDNYATKLNGFGSKFKPGEFLEARRELEKSGFGTVAGEYGNINNQLKTRFIQNDFEKGLKLGQYPFRLGEQSTRLTAWYTAFREFREANPNTPITNLERQKILSKADLLTVNMSRASNSGLSHGVFSLSTQFLSYQIKLAELFLGKRLGETTLERNMARARILTAFTALYGLPNAIGVTGAPFSDNLREHFMDDLGYIPGEKWWSTMVNEGLPAWTMSMITGKLDNVGDRFGSQGFQNIKQMLRGDVPFLIAMGGAGVSTSWNFLKAFNDPYWQWYNSWMRGDTPDDRFRITGSDLLQPWKEISSVSTAAKLWSAIPTGKWISKNEQNITDVTPLHAALLSVTGLSPQEQDTLFTQNQMIKGEQDAKKKALAGFIVDWRRGIQTRGMDEDQSIQYFKNAMARAVTAGMDPAEINTAIAVATKAAGANAIDDSDYKLWTQGDVNKRQQRMEQFRTKQKMKDQQ